MVIRWHVLGAVRPVLACMCVPAVIAGQFGTPKEDLCWEEVTWKNVHGGGRGRPSTFHNQLVISYLDRYPSPR